MYVLVKICILFPVQSAAVITADKSVLCSHCGYGFNQRIPSPHVEDFPHLSLRNTAPAAEEISAVQGDILIREKELQSLKASIDKLRNALDTLEARQSRIPLEARQSRAKDLLWRQKGTIFSRESPRNPRRIHEVFLSSAPVPSIISHGTSTTSVNDGVESRSHTIDPGR
ncbi:hypothetical protein C8J56DRAFT_890861 [Mycena floridula]|nr:hypothetical protein C8J56DRAFT_890861 [Mycena floridula]